MCTDSWAFTHNMHIRLRFQAVKASWKWSTSTNELVTQPFSSCTLLLGFFNYHALVASPEGQVSVAERESGAKLRQGPPCNGNRMVICVSEGLEVRQFSNKEVLRVWLMCSFMAGGLLSTPPAEWSVFLRRLWWSLFCCGGSASREVQKVRVQYTLWVFFI